MVLTSSELRFLVWATEGMSGADIEMLVDAGKRFFVLHSPSENGDGEQSDLIEGLFGARSFWRGCVARSY